jgi:hypothetical protein
MRSCLRKRAPVDLIIEIPLFVLASDMQVWILTILPDHLHEHLLGDVSHRKDGIRMIMFDT